MWVWGERVREEVIYHRPITLHPYIPSSQQVLGVARGCWGWVKGFWPIMRGNPDILANNPNPKANNPRYWGSGGGFECQMRCVMMHQAKLEGESHTHAGNPASGMCLLMHTWTHEHMQVGVCLHMPTCTCSCVCVGVCMHRPIIVL